jgi:hypothetical protein
VREKKLLPIALIENAFNNNNKKHKECAMNKISVMQYLNLNSNKENKPPTTNDKQAKLTRKLQAKQVN